MERGVRDRRMGKVGWKNRAVKIKVELTGYSDVSLSDTADGIPTVWLN